MSSTNRLRFIGKGDVYGSGFATMSRPGMTAKFSREAIA
jgi:hypothetical protein